MWTQLIPAVIPIAIQGAKALGLRERIPQKWGRVIYPALALALGALSGMGFSGEADLAMAALEGAGVSGLAAIGVHSAVKNLAQGLRAR